MSAASRGSVAHSHVHLRLWLLHSSQLVLVLVAALPDVTDPAVDQARRLAGQLQRGLDRAAAVVATHHDVPHLRVGAVAGLLLQGAAQVLELELQVAAGGCSSCGCMMHGCLLAAHASVGPAWLELGAGGYTKRMAIPAS